MLWKLFLFGCRDVSTPEIAAHSTSLFQTGWFVESLLSQTLIIHIIRTQRIPWLQSWPSATLLLTTLAVTLFGVTLPYTPLGASLGFIPLPALFWLLLGGTLVAYAILTQGVKQFLHRRGLI